MTRNSNAAATLRTTLTASPGLTVKAAAFAAGLGVSTVGNMLVAWEKGGTARRETPDKGAARWFLTDAGEAPAQPADAPRQVVIAGAQGVMVGGEDEITADERPKWTTTIARATITSGVERVSDDDEPTDARPVVDGMVGESGAEMPTDPGTDDPARSTMQPGPKTRKRAAVRGAAKTAKTAAPAAAATGRRPGGLREQTVLWHYANPTTDAKAETLKALFGAKWAGPIRLHQRALVDAGFLVRVGTTAPEIYRWKRGATLPDGLAPADGPAVTGNPEEKTVEHYRNA